MTRQTRPRRAGACPDRRLRAPSRAVVALLAVALAGPHAVDRANAEPRFGDSTWVAPAATFDRAVALPAKASGAGAHERRWETALRAPFRVAFAPLRLAGDGLEAGVGWAGPRWFDPRPPRPPKRGPELSPHITVGAVNDVGAGPSLAWAGFPVAGATLHASGSWSTIDRRRASLTETLRDGRTIGIRLGADYDDVPNQRYYGIGNSTPQSNLAYFQLASLDAGGALLLGASPVRQLRIGAGYSTVSPRRGAHGSPVLDDLAESGGTPFVHRTTRARWYGVAADLATLDDGRDPSRGAEGRFDVRRAAGVNASDPDYDQWQAEGRAYVPVFAPRRVIAVRGVYAGIRPRGDAAAALPFYRLEESEGDLRFAGYTSERFRDRQLVLARVEYRWAILFRLNALALYELGEVAPEAAAFRAHDLHAAYGGGLRLGWSARSAVRLEVARGSEGLHAVLALGSGF